MKIKHLKKEIKGVFMPPVKRRYLGKIKFGTPYFYPMHFEPFIFSCRILKKRTKEDRQNYINRYNTKQYDIDAEYSNLPMVKRNKYWVFKIFGKHIYLSVGYPLSIHRTGLGWKDKYDTPRFEWAPSFSIFFFAWQYVHWWTSPDNDNDQYYEQIIWWKYYSDKDMKKAESTWCWVDGITKKSTWNIKYLI